MKRELGELEEDGAMEGLAEAVGEAEGGGAAGAAGAAAAAVAAPPPSSSSSECTHRVALPDSTSLSTDASLFSLST